MEIKKEVIEEILIRLFNVFEKNNISCEIFGKNGWRGIDIKKDFKAISQSVEENDPNIYKTYSLIDFYIKMAEAIFSGKNLIDFLTYMTSSLSPKETEEEKIREFKNFIDKDIKVQKLYKKFREKKLQIPAQDKELNIMELSNYIRNNDTVTLCCKITNFNYITISYKNLWKYYYLSLLAEEPLLLYNLHSKEYKEIDNLFI